MVIKNGRLLITGKGPTLVEEIVKQQRFKMGILSIGGSDVAEEDALEIAN